METALEAITDSVYMVWNGGKNSVINLLSLDVPGAFDNVSQYRRLQNLREGRVLNHNVQPRSSFLTDLWIFLALGTRTGPVEKVETGILQGLSVSRMRFFLQCSTDPKICEACPVDPGQGLRRRDPLTSFQREHTKGLSGDEADLQNLRET